MMFGDSSFPVFPENDALTMIRLALAEDVRTGDVTSAWTIPETQKETARLIAKEAGVIAGLPVIVLVFRELKADVKITLYKKDGDIVAKGDIIAELSGTTRDLLTGVRTLQKYAVRVGGGANHRMGLFDMVLVKDNHIAAAGGVLPALEAVRAHNKANLPVEMEVENLDDLRKLLNKSVDVIMLDNMTNAMMQDALKIVRESGDTHVRIEASGNMNLARAKEIAGFGLDFISVGALTHSVKALDISMRIQ